MTGLPDYGRHQIRVVLLLLITYVGFYFCRTTLPTSMPQLQSDFEYSRQQVGQIASFYFAVYAAAKLFNGCLGVRLAARVLLLLGITGSVACNVAFSFGRTLPFFSTIWSINAIFQSMGWIAIVGVVSHWFLTSQSGKALATISISYLFGDTIARTSAGLILQSDAFGWRELFWIHSAVLAFVGLLVAVLLKPSPRAAGLPSLARPETPAPEFKQAPSPHPSPSLPASPNSMQLIARLFANSHFRLVCVIYLCLSTIRYAFWIWSVDYLQQECGLPLGSAAITSAVLPLAGTIGALAAGFLSDRRDGRRGPVLAIMTAALLISLGGFVLAPKDVPGLKVASLGLVGFFLIGPYSLLAGAVAVDFGSKRLATTASGVIDAIGAVGAIAMGAGMGHCIDSIGWNGAFGMLVAIGVAALLLSLTLWNARFASVAEEPH